MFNLRLCLGSANEALVGPVQPFVLSGPARHSHTGHMLQLVLNHSSQLTASCPFCLPAVLRCAVPTHQPLVTAVGGGMGGWGGGNRWGGYGGWGRKLRSAQEVQEAQWGGYGGYGGSNSWSNANAAAGSGSFGGPWGGGSNSWAQAQAGASSSSWGRKLRAASKAPEAL
jgi:hypothetical protein